MAACLRAVLTSSRFLKVGCSAQAASCTQYRTGLGLRQLQQHMGQPSWYSTDSKGTDVDPAEVEKEYERLKLNPMFDKYKAQLEAAKLEGKVKPIKRVSAFAAPSKAANKLEGAEGEATDEEEDGQSLLAPPDQNPTMKSLDSILKLELLKDLSPEDVSKLWLEYHKDKESICAVIPTLTYTKLMERSKECPMFLYPLPRDDGFEFFYAQWYGHQCAFTPLIEYQARQADSVPQMLMNHYQELRDSHGIILMSGELEKALKSTDAHILASQVVMYYSGSEHAYEAVETFNKRPADFDHTELITRLETLNM